MERTFVPFNINEMVRVRLTDHGRKIHRERFRNLNARIPLSANMKYTPPTEDAEGWSRWQLWSLIEVFGNHVGMCLDPPFEISIEFEVTRPEEQTKQQ